MNNPAKDPNDLLDAADIAVELGLSTGYIHRLIRKGDIERHELSFIAYGLVRVRRYIVDAFKVKRGDGFRRGPKPKTDTATPSKKALAHMAKQARHELKLLRHFIRTHASRNIIERTADNYIARHHAWQIARYGKITKRIYRAKLINQTK